MSAAGRGATRDCARGDRGQRDGPGIPRLGTRAAPAATGSAPPSARLSERGGASSGPGRHSVRGNRPGSQRPDAERRAPALGRNPGRRRRTVGAAVPCRPPRRAFHPHDIMGTGGAGQSAGRRTDRALSARAAPPHPRGTKARGWRRRRRWVRAV